MTNPELMLHVNALRRFADIDVGADEVDEFESRHALCLAGVTPVMMSLLVQRERLKISMASVEDSVQDKEDTKRWIFHHDLELSRLATEIQLPDDIRNDLGIIQVPEEE